MTFNDHWNEFAQRKFNHHLCTCGCQPHSCNHRQTEQFHDFCMCKKRPHRLKPLELGLTQRLNKLLNHNVIVELLSGEENDPVKGILCLVGVDFIEICIEAVGQHQDQIQVIPFNAIKCIKLDET